MSIKKIQKTSLTDQVSATIKGYIIKKEWLPGFKIPSENDLAEMFGVNRLTVRMALQKLNTVGILETKAGDGTFVKEFNFSDYISEISDLFISKEMIDDVLEFRKVIEIEAIRLSIEKASNEDIQILEQAYYNLEKTSKNYIETDINNINGFQKTIEADLEFHYQICVASKNIIFPAVFNAVKELLLQYMKSIYQQRQNEKTFVAGFHSHMDIIRFIKDRDFESCKKAYLKTIDYKIIP